MRTASEGNSGNYLLSAKESALRNLHFKNAMIAPLVVGIALTYFANTEAGNHLPGRVVDSTEASAVLGTGRDCFNVRSGDCSGSCTGEKSVYSSSQWNNEKSEDGCDANCSAPAIAEGSCAG
jgi:hypothetical protein